MGIPKINNFKCCFKEFFPSQFRDMVCHKSDLLRYKNFPTKTNF